MSVFSCRVLAVDWQIAPKTPVLTTVAGQTSLNYDNYSDTESGLQPGAQYQTQYPNIPDIFPAEASITAAMDWPTAEAIIEAAPAGSVVWFEDGTYDWSAYVGGTFLDITNNNGTVDDPIYCVARNKHLAQFTGGTGGIRLFSPHFIWCGMRYLTSVVNNASRTNILGSRMGWFRCTSCLFENCGISGLIDSGWVNESSQSKNVEYDNNDYDGQSADTTWPTPIKVSGPSSYTALSNPQHIRLHHNHFHDILRSFTGQLWVVGGNGTNTDPSQGFPNNNLDLDEYFYIIENNLAGNCELDSEMFENKGAVSVMRYNVFHDQSGARLRSYNNHQFYGNWFENANRCQINLSGGFSLLAFNFLQAADDATNRNILFLNEQRNTSIPFGLNYFNSESNMYKHNVTSGAGDCLRAGGDNAGLDFVATPLGCLFEGNQFNSAFIAASDADGAGNYHLENVSGLELTETEWRAANTWGVNEYNATPIATQTGGINSNAFDGPGATLLATNETLMAPLWGQPSQIPMPSWWKLP